MGNTTYYTGRLRQFSELKARPSHSPEDGRKGIQVQQEQQPQMLQSDHGHCEALTHATEHYGCVRSVIDFVQSLRPALLPHRLPPPKTGQKVAIAGTFAHSIYRAPPPFFQPYPLAYAPISTAKSTIACQFCILDHFVWFSPTRNLRELLLKTRGPSLVRFGGKEMQQDRSPSLRIHGSGLLV